MPSGAKKRKAARKKKAAEENNQSSIEEESSSKLELIDENTTVPVVDDGLDPSIENSTLGLPTDHAISVVEEVDELVANDHNNVLNSNEEDFVHDANIAVIEEISDWVSNEHVDENTTVPVVDEGLDPSIENSTLGLPTDHAISVVEEIYELVANDHNDVLNSNEEDFVHDANIAVIEEISDWVSNEHVEAGQGLSCVDDISVAVVQENVQTLLVQQNMLAHQISEQLEGLKKMVIEELCAVDNTRTSLHKVLDGLTKIQQTVVEQ